MTYLPCVVSVVRTEQLSATFRRLTLGSPELADLAWAGADQRVKLLLPAPGQLAELAGRGSRSADTSEGVGWYEWWRALPDEVRPPMRTYTIAGHRPDAYEVDVDFAVHGDGGPLSGFALSARVGDRLLLVAPRRSADAGEGVAWRPGRAQRLLCIGDETALPAIRNILSVLEPGQACRVVLEVPDASDRLPLPSPGTVHLEWVVRPPGSAVGAATEARLFGAPGSPASPSLPDLDLWQEATDADSDSYAWVAGEVGWVNRLRRHLAPIGYGRGNAAFMGYWRAGHPAVG